MSGDVAVNADPARAADSLAHDVVGPALNAQRCAACAHHEGVVEVEMVEGPRDALRLALPVVGRPPRDEVGPRGLIDGPALPARVAGAIRLRQDMQAVAEARVVRGVVQNVAGDPAETPARSVVDPMRVFVVKDHDV